jgi:hypothetical protein
MMNDVSTNFCANTGSAGSALNSSTFTGGKYLDSPYWMPRKKRRGKQLSLSAKSVTASNAAIRAAIVGSSAITCAVWIKVNKVQLTAGPIVGFKTSATNAGFYLSNEVLGRLAIFARESEITAAVSTVAVQKWSDLIGRWVLVSAEVNYAQDFGKIYLNGVLIAQGTLAFTASAYSDAGNPQINVTASTSEAHTLDDARIYNRVLTPEEHYQLYLDNAPRDGLLVEYTFDNDVEGTSVIDTSGNGYHGTPTGITSVNYVTSY